MITISRASIVALAAALAISTSALDAQAAGEHHGGGGAHMGGAHVGGGHPGGGWHGGGHQAWAGRGGHWHGGGGNYARGGVGFGWGPAAVLGVAGGALAAGAIASQNCYAQQPTYDNFGNFIGYQSVYTCN